jgi:hypothetical protein
MLSLTGLPAKLAKLTKLVALSITGFVILHAPVFGGQDVV